MSAGATLDARELRHVLGAFATGVTVITTLDRAGVPHGLTANSFTSVSLDPPLVLWSQSLTAPSHQVFRDAERFAVNILSEDQVDISNRFARGGGDKFATCSVREGIDGLPLLEGCAAYLECRKVTMHPGGDHMVFLGHVERIERAALRPLVFGGGKYLVTQPHDLGAFSIDIAAASLARLHAVRLATRAAVELARELDETIGVAVWGNHGPTMVCWEPAREPVSVNLRVGLVLPVLDSATGLAFAAWLAPELTRPLIDAERRARTPPRRTEDLSEILATFRRDGIARAVGTDHFRDLYGTTVSALAAPVFDAAGDIALTLTCVGAGDKLDCGAGARVPSALLRCAAELSRRLGHLAANPSSSTVKESSP